MVRTSRFILLLFFFAAVAHIPTEAQPATRSPLNLEVETSIQAVLLERSPLATGIGGALSWWVTPRWGIRGEVRRDVGVNRDLQIAYNSTTPWGDDRRLNGTVALVWEAFRGETGSVTHSLRLHGGPTVQRQRSERLRFIGSVSEAELSNAVQGQNVDRVYVEENATGPGMLVAGSYKIRQINWGGTVGLKYGLHYGRVALHFGLMARTVDNLDGTTFGAGGGLTVSL